MSKRWPRSYQRTPATRGSLRQLVAGVMLAAHCGSAHDAAAAGPQRRWYGEMTLLADGSALTFLLASVAVNDRDGGRWLLLGSGAAYLVGAPVVHITHDRSPAALASLGLRVGSVALGGLLGSQLSGLAAYDDGNEVVIGTVLGVLSGIVTAVTVDAAVLAWEPLPEQVQAPEQRSWWPTLALTSERSALGVAGHF